MDGESLLTDSHTNVCLHTHNSTEYPLQRTKGKKWPVLFWAILKVLGLFHHERVVTSSKCYLCRVKSRLTRLDLLRRADPECGAGTDDVNLDQLMLAYDVESDEEEGSLSTDMMSVTRTHVQNHDDLCETCCAHWWNGYGVPVVYTESDIGVSSWNHRGSGLLSTIFLLAQLGGQGYLGGALFFEMWGRPEHTLHLLIRTMVVAVLLIYPTIALFSRVGRCRVWATVLNVRYLIKRGQFLNLQTQCLPGKPFLLICGLSPILVIGYRIFVYSYFGKCDPSAEVYMVATSLVTVIFLEMWCLLVYIIYFMRASFHRQFNLQLAHLKTYEGNVKKCKGALFETAMDFLCFRRFVDFFAALMFPFVTCGVVANVTWNYLLGGNNCLMSKGDALPSEIYLAILYWTEIGFALFLYPLAVGGFRVGYMWESFLLNLAQFEASGNCTEFWRGILQDMAHFSTGSKVLLVSVVVSVIGIYAGIELSNQSVVFLATTCNIYNTTNFC